MQKLSFIRIFSGTLKKDDSVHAVGRPQGGQAAPAAERAGQRDAAHRRRPAPATSWPWPRSRSCTPASSLGDVALPPIKFPTPMVGLAVTPKSRGDEGKLSGALHKIAEEDGTFQLRPRRADQGDGDDRHERAAPADHSRTAQAPRQGRGRHQGAEDSLSRNDPGQRPKAAIATRSSRAAAASSARCTSACSHCPRASTRGVRHQGPLPLACASFTTTRRTTSCGSTRSSAARFPATSCRPSKRVSRSGWSAA